MDNILVIDDEEGIRFSLNKVLTHFGYKVTVAQDGEEGIKLFDKGTGFDLIITGICMPKKDGNEVAKYIRSSKKANTPMVAITGSDEHEIDRPLFNFLLEKPFSMESLIEAIRSSKVDNKRRISADPPE